MPIHDDEYYADRLCDLIDEGEDDDVDMPNVIMNYVLGFVEAATEESNTEGITYDIGDKRMIIILEDVYDQPPERMH